MALLPAPVLIDLLNVVQSSPSEREESEALALGRVEREYSWRNSDGVVMFATSGPEWGDTSALFVKMTALSPALKTRGLGWWTWVLGEKIIWRHGEPTADRLDIFGSAGLGNRGLDPWSFAANYIDHGAPDQGKS